MKILKLVLVFSGALLIGGAAGFFVCYLTKAQPLERANEARRIHADSLSGVLADSIAANEAWIEAEKAEQAQISRNAKASFVSRFGDGPESNEAILLYERQEQDAYKEALPYLIRARQHIDRMKQEKAWIESLR